MTDCRGRPPKYENAEQIEELIEEYFKKCEGEIVIDDDGNVLTDKHGNPIVKQAKPPTVTGLALALGFTSRQALLYYQGKKEYADIITRAKSLVEEYTEQLRDGISCRVARPDRKQKRKKRIFELKRYRLWRDNGLYGRELPP